MEAPAEAGFSRIFDFASSIKSDEDPGCCDEVRQAALWIGVWRMARLYALHDALSSEKHQPPGGARCGEVEGFPEV
jgi:hypothetical protein